MAMRDRPLGSDPLKLWSAPRANGSSDHAEERSTRQDSPLINLQTARPWIAEARYGCRRKFSSEDSRDRSTYIQKRSMDVEEETQNKTQIQKAKEPIVGWKLYWCGMGLEEQGSQLN